MWFHLDRPTDYAIDQRFMDFTQGFDSSPIVPLQISDQNERGLYDFILPSLYFGLLILAALLVYFGFSTFFSFNTSKRNLQIKILFFSLIIFLFFMAQFFTEDLNASDVVIVDTSIILHSREQSSKQCLTGHKL